MPLQELVKQVGGNHYKGDYKHWDLVIEFNISYLEACATKYLSRWRDKDGIKDLEKAISYIDKLMSVQDGDYYRSFTVNPNKLRKWFAGAEVPGSAQEACWLILWWEGKEDLEKARSVVQAIIDKEKSSAHEYYARDGLLAQQQNAYHHWYNNVVCPHCSNSRYTNQG